MTAREVDHLIAAVAANQCGLVSRAQILSTGGTDDVIGTRLGSGQLISCGPGVYSLPGIPPSFMRSLWIAHLAAGPASSVSHESAGAVHWLTGFPKGPIVLTIRHPGHARVAGAFIHQLQDVRPSHLVQVRGLSVTSVPRTIVDLAAVSRPVRLGIALDDAVAARQTSFADVGRCLRDVARRGKPGVCLLGSLLDERGTGYVPAASALERDMFELLDRYNLPKPRRQAPFPGRQLITGCTDGLYDDCLLILEADGRRWHTRLRDLARDHQRDQEAARAGYETLRLLHEDIRLAPKETAELVLETRRIRLRQLAA